MRPLSTPFGRASGDASRPSVLCQPTLGGQQAKTPPSRCRISTTLLPGSGYGKAGEPPALPKSYHSYGDSRNPQEVDVFFELRQYRTLPGQRENWVKFMEEKIIPFQVAQGMVILGSFVGQEEDDLYVWIRRFESEAERERLYEAVYESDYWKNEVAPQVPQMLDRGKIVVTRIESTPKSAIH